MPRVFMKTEYLSQVRDKGESSELTARGAWSTSTPAHLRAHDAMRLPYCLAYVGCTTGGSDGNKALNSVESFDRREGAEIAFPSLALRFRLPQGPIAAPPVRKPPILALPKPRSRSRKARMTESAWREDDLLSSACLFPSHRLPASPFTSPSLCQSPIASNQTSAQDDNLLAHQTMIAGDV